MAFFVVCSVSFEDSPMRFSPPFHATQFAPIARILWLAAILTGCFSNASASAAPVPAPSGLHPGDVYYRIFATSLAETANSMASPFSGPAFAGIDSADHWVTDAAINAGLLTSNAHAVVSVVTASNLDRLNIASPIYNTNNQLVASSSAALAKGTLAHAVGYDEFGRSLPTGSMVWTGTSSGARAFGGDPFSTGKSWDSGYLNSWNGHEHFYGICGPFRVVPEPASLVLVALAIACFATRAVFGCDRAAPRFSPMNPGGDRV
jgi:hypothetical protein